MAGIVVRGRFPRRRMVQVVGTNIFRYIFRGAARNWARNMGSTAPALGSMTLLLFLSGVIGLSGLALYNLEQIEAGQASVLHVYIRDSAASADVDALWDRLAQDRRVASVALTTKAQALKRAQRIPGLPQLADASESNPFPASLDVQVKNINDVAAIDASVRNDIAVDPAYPTSYDQGAYQRIQAVLFGLSRRDEVSIMQLVGAPRWMVRGPFLVEGAITGGIAGAVAGAVTFGLAMTGIAAGSSSFAQFAPGITAAVAALAGATVFAAGLGLGSGSSLVSLRRHLES